MSKSVHGYEAIQKSSRPGQKRSSQSKAGKCRGNAIGKTSSMSISSLLDEHEGGGLHIIEIYTVQGGYNCGKVYHLNATSEGMRVSWAAALESSTADALKRAAPHPLAVYQRRLRHIYRHPWFQSGVAVIMNKLDSTLTPTCRQLLFGRRFSSLPAFSPMSYKQNFNFPQLAWALVATTIALLIFLR
jgi:hypothetical protein